MKQPTGSVLDLPGLPSIDQTTSAFSAFATTMRSAIEDFVQGMTPPTASGGWGSTQARARSWRSGAPRSEPRRCGCPCHGQDTHEHGCSCDDCADCGPSPCDCTCCIGDVDLVVYARLGERRVAPIEIHNPRRREREIDIELSDFTTRGGRPAGIKASLVGGGKVTLGPCQTHSLVLVVEVAQLDDPGNDQPGDVDVDDCVVATADLRILGCDMRSQRIAVAVLPRRCAAYGIECRAECC